MRTIINVIRAKLPIFCSLDEQYGWRNRPLPQTAREIEVELRQIARVVCVHPPLQERRDKLQDLRTTLSQRTTEEEVRALLGREPKNGVFYTGPKIERGG